VLLGDVLVPDNSILPQMLEISRAHDNASVIAVVRVPHEQVSRFGVIDGDKLSAPANTVCATESEGAGGSAVWRVNALVEKPPVDEAPSDLAIFGRYLLSPRIMQILAYTKPGAGGEIQLTDAMVELLQSEEMYALEIDPAAGFDTGTIATWLETNIRLAMRDPALASMIT
jgi:UTP--glucose-1-phosphate uridylyltransferase